MPSSLPGARKREGHKPAEEAYEAVIHVLYGQAYAGLRQRADIGLRGFDAAQLAASGQSTCGPR